MIEKHTGYILFYQAKCHVSECKRERWEEVCILAMCVRKSASERDREREGERAGDC